MQLLLILMQRITSVSSVSITMQQRVLRAYILQRENHPATTCFMSVRTAAWASPCNNVLYERTHCSVSITLQQRALWAYALKRESHPAATCFMSVRTETWQSPCNNVLYERTHCCVWITRQQRALRACVKNALSKFNDADKELE